MRSVLLVPGIHNSGPDHWQSLWESRYSNVIRVVQRDWDHPVCGDWVDAIDDAVRRTGEPPIIVAHSLGCLAVARWSAQAGASAHALLLVAVPDPDGPAFPSAASGFGGARISLRNRRIMIVSSSDDPYATPAYTDQCVADWQAEHVLLGPVGHINAMSGLGAWLQGWAIVERWRSAPTTQLA